MSLLTGRAAGVLDDMRAVAAARLAEPVSYTFDERERRALEPFFSNAERRVFFVQGLPTVVLSALLAMYSRLKNPRGLRGHFVDNLVPHLVGQGWETFAARAGDPELWRDLANADHITTFLAKWLDAYGHNSIARTGQVVLCVEECSQLAAKSLEWSRPGAGYIELSTRYVDFSKKSLYPVWDEVACFSPTLADNIRASAEAGMHLYRGLMGDDVDGPFPRFLREHYRAHVADTAKLKQAVLGESCDVLGNLLPCATLTSLGIAVSGETFPQVLRHLVQDGTPENLALADAIVAEAGPAGVASFIRHWEPTVWEQGTWKPLRQLPRTDSLMPRFEDAARAILTALDVWPGPLPIAAVNLFDTILPVKRGEFDKLPRAFETVSAFFERMMTFRGWRDLHRMGFCTHQRALVTPELGFYAYPKPAPPELLSAFSGIHGVNVGLFESTVAQNAPQLLAQYGMAMGNIIRYQIAANLRQWEFCNWQRTKWAVNDEVRGQFLSIEYALRATYPWWRKISRADTTWHYAFARGERIPLT